jgi:hypothetical protein
MRSPARYNNVKSKIARNLKVAKKVAKKKRSPKKESNYQMVFNDSEEEEGEEEENALDGSIYSSPNRQVANKSLDAIGKSPPRNKSKADDKIK